LALTNVDLPKAEDLDRKCIRKYALSSVLSAPQVTTFTPSSIATWADGLFHASGSIMRAVEAFWAGLEIHGRHVQTIKRTQWNMDSANTLLWETNPLPRSHTLAQTPQVDIHFCVLTVFAKQSFYFSSFHNPLSLILIFAHLTHHTHTDTRSRP
jgi:hypothetical protein